MGPNTMMLPSQVAFAIVDSASELNKLLGHSREYLMDNFYITTWVQTWSDTSLGFGGMAGQTICSAHTIVVESPHDLIYRVYVGGRFAYQVDRPLEAFYIAMREHTLRGKANYNPAEYERG